MRGPEWREKMHRVNMQEKAELQEKFFSEEAIERITSRFGSKL